MGFGQRKSNDLKMLIKFFLRKNLSSILAFFLAAFIVLTVFFAYSLPTTLVFYAFLLASTAMILVGIFRFYRMVTGYRNLQALEKQLAVTRISLPTPKGASEKCYSDMIEMLQEERAALLSEKDKALSEMADYYAIWAHQIKIPLAAFRLLLQSEDDLNLRKAELAEQLFKVEEYVEMALSFVRSENLGGDLLLRKTDMNTILKNSLKKYSRSFIRKKIALCYEPVDIKIITDEKWISFIIEQVLSNALKYTREGTITIRWEEPKVLLIEDTGIGIREEDLPRIFEKSFTGFNGREEKTSTGIGLYLCKKVAQRLGCDIKIASKKGAGTQVRIIFDQ